MLDLVDSVKVAGGTVRSATTQHLLCTSFHSQFLHRMFSSSHVSGERELLEFALLHVLLLFSIELGQLSGVAAILRFPLPEIEEEDGDSDDGVT